MEHTQSQRSISLGSEFNPSSGNQPFLLDQLVQEETAAENVIIHDGILGQTLLNNSPKIIQESIELLDAFDQMTSNQTFTMPCKQESAVFDQMTTNQTVKYEQEVRVFDQMPCKQESTEATHHNLSESEIEQSRNEPTQGRENDVQITSDIEVDKDCECEDMNTTVDVDGDVNDVESCGPEEPVENLPASLAILELVEYLLVHMQRGSGHRSGVIREVISVKVKSMTPETSGGNDDQCWFAIKVICKCQCEEDLDLQEMLRKHGGATCEVIQGMNVSYRGWHLVYKPARSHFAQCFTLEESTNTVLEKVESIDRFSSKHTLSFRVRQSYSHMVSQCQIVRSHLHKLKLFNPLVHILFNLETSDATIASDFGNTTNSMSLNKKLVTTSSFYVSDASEDVVEYQSGKSYVIGKVTSLGEGSVTLRTVVKAALIQQSADTGDDIRPTHLQVYMVGPSDVATMVSGLNSLSVPAQVLANLDGFGLQHINGNSPAFNKLEQVVPDLHSELSSSDHTPRAESTEEATNQETEKAPCILLLVFMIDRSDKQQHSTWQQLNLLQAIRENLSMLVCNNKNKFKQAVTAAVNKLLPNLLHQEKKQEVIGNAIDMIMSSVMSVIKLSTNQAFKQDISNTLQVEDCAGADTALRSGLWEIARQCHDVKQTDIPTHKRSSTHTDTKDTVVSRQIDAEADCEMMPSSLAADGLSQVEVETEEPNNSPQHIRHAEGPAVVVEHVHTGHSHDPTTAHCCQNADILTEILSQWDKLTGTDKPNSQPGPQQTAQGLTADWFEDMLTPDWELCNFTASDLDVINNQTTASEL